MEANEAWAVPDTVYAYDNETRVLALQWPGTDALTTPTTTIWHNGTNESSTLQSGDSSLAGRVQSSGSLSSWVGGEDYVLAFTVTKGGQVITRQQMVKVIQRGAVR